MHKMYREAHPLAFVITHWLNLLAMLFLTLSGLYIHYPLFGSWMGVARGTHQFWWWVLLITLVVRIVLAFIVKSATRPDTREVDTDVKNFIPQPENRHQLWQWIKYYLFLRKTTPIGGKYNPLQKVSYGLIVPILILIAAYTGFCLWEPTSTLPLFQAGTDWAASLTFGGDGGGDPMNIRIIHYFTMWAILLFTAVHVYLANIYGFAPSKLMFLWKESE